MARPAADQHLERLLVMIPWIITQDGPTVKEVCARFHITERELVSDLELLFMCGLYPFTPDTLIEADIIDERVWIRYADSFQRPPMFTAEEAVSLVAAASTVLDFPEYQEGDDRTVLASALRKLSTALGIDDEEVVEIELAPAADSTIEALRKATEEHCRVEVDYYSYGRDVWTRRKFEPHQVFNAEGQWYVQGIAVEANESRTFRLDRMRNVEVLTETFPMPKQILQPSTYQARDDDPTLVLDLDETSHWVAEQYPIEAMERVGGHSDTLRVTLRVSEQAWVERLLFRLGDHARVVSGEVDLTASAERILQKYDHHQ